MKRLFTALVSILLINGVSYAGHITHTDYTSGATITASGQNNNENAIVNEMNGNLDNTNITAGGITTANLASAVQAQFVPTGSVFYWVGSTNSVPSGYLYCNGQAVSRTTYALLFNAIGVSFGQGDNSTTFNLPDMRGYFVRGLNDASGNDPNAATRTAATTGGNTGDNIGSVEAAALASHVHSVSVTDPGHGHDALGLGTGSSGAVGLQDISSTGLAGIAKGGGYTTSDNGGDRYIHTNTTGITATANATGGSETRPLNINMAGIIKY